MNGLLRAAVVVGSVTTIGAGTVAAGLGTESGKWRVESGNRNGLEQPQSQGDPAYVLGHTMKRLDGSEESLEKYKGKVVVIVNVASRCGYTPQYEGLERLYQAKKDKGLVVLGLPANNFGGQEPGSNEEIAEFCSGTYGVTFPMFQKISVKGEDQHALYEQLASQPPPVGGDPKWNFTKFVVDREGRVVARYDADRKTAKPPELEPALLRNSDELLGEGGKKEGGEEKGGGGSGG